LPRPILAALALAGLLASGPGPAATSDDAAEVPPGTEIATFAGGCFWCVESDFDHVDGVLRTVSGYTGGRTADPTYHRVSAGGTGHYEAVQIYYDPEQTSYEKLLDVFWRSIDPTDDGGQFCDRGESYLTAIFASSNAQRQAAEASKTALAGKLPDPIVTPVLAAGPFYPAEDYHQNYYEKNPARYTFYRFSCGRDSRVRDLWGEEAHRGIER
jgi:peptide-methionine (S)-S-oxide reductase